MVDGAEASALTVFSGYRFVRCAAAHEVGSVGVGLKSPTGPRASKDSIMFVFRVQQELGVPVKLVGLGEGPDDLAPFEPAAFVDALLG
jgi:hypothetical protein